MGNKNRNKIRPRSNSLGQVVKRFCWSMLSPREMHESHHHKHKSSHANSSQVENSHHNHWPTKTWQSFQIFTHPIFILSRRLQYCHGINTGDECAEYPWHSSIGDEFQASHTRHPMRVSHRERRQQNKRNTRGERESVTWYRLGAYLLASFSWLWNLFRKKWCDTILSLVLFGDENSVKHNAII